MINLIALFYDLVIVLYYGIECYTPCKGYMLCSMYMALLNLL